MPRTMTKTVLDPARRKVISQAFTDWYNAQPRGSRTEAMERIGATTKQAHAWKSGTRIPPPIYLAQLFQLTGDNRFRLTAAEKTAYAVDPRTLDGVPEAATWPDLEVATEFMALVPVAQIAAEIAAIIAAIKPYADLPRTDPRWREAQQLRRPAMMLYRVLKELGHPFPESFKDIARQLDLAAETLK